MNEDAEVMAQALQENLVELRGRELAPDVAAELALHGGERALDVRAAVVVREEFGAVQRVQVPEALPRRLIPPNWRGSG